MGEKRIYKPEEKLKIVLEGMSGTIQVSELCRKEELLNSSSDIFENRGRKPDIDGELRDKEQEIARLKDVIAEITSENLELKKKNGQSGQGRGRI